MGVLLNTSTNIPIEESLIVLLNYIVDPIVVSDQTGKLLFVNDGVTKTIGYGQDELQGKLIFQLDFIDEKDRKIMVQNAQNRMRGLKVEPYEIQATTKSGEIKYLELIGNPIRLDNNVLNLTIFHDVSERKFAQRKLENKLDIMSKECLDHEVKVKTIFEASPDAIAFFDLKGNISECNQAMVDLLDFPSKEELLGKNGVSLLWKDQEHRDIIAQLIINSNSVVNFEVAALTKKRKEFQASCSAKAIRNSFEKPLGYVMVAKDITSSKKMEQAIQYSEEKFRTLSNVVKDALIVVDDKNEVVYWNPAAEKTFGYNKEEASGKRLHELVVPPDLPEEGRKVMHQNLKQSAHEGEGPFMEGTVELAGRRKDGTVFPVEVSISSFMLKDKHHSVGVARDITDRKMEQQKLEDYSKYLEKMVDARTDELKESERQLLKAERLATIGELAGMVGHDLRNPLAGIKNASYFLKKKCKLNCQNPAVPAISMLDIIDAAVDHSNKIINNLVNYSMEIQLNFTDCNPKSLIAAVVQNKVEVPKRIELIDQTFGEHVFSADTSKIEDVFAKIIANSIDAMPENGQLQICSKMSGNNIEIAFVDDGVGIPELNLSKIFNPLYTTKAQGMGFGLAICKRIIEAHGGKIFAENNQTKGAKFTVILPIEPEMKNELEVQTFVVPQSVLA